MPEPRAVLLDLWHTLAYLEPAEEEAYMSDQLETVAHVLAQWPRSPRGRHPPMHDPRRAAEEIRVEAAEAAHRGVSMPFGVQATHAARRLGRVAYPLALTRALASLLDRTPLRLAPGAVDTLATLQRRRFLIGVISNTVGEPGEAVQRRMERAGLGAYIDAWALSDQLPWAKPAPEIFWHCLGMLSVRRERAVHVGDGWPDLAGARAAGLRAGILYTGLQRYGDSYRRLFAPRRNGLPPPEFQVQRLEELPDLAERLLTD